MDKSFFEIFDQLDSNNRRNCVRIAATFPRTENIEKGKQPILKTIYKCNDTNCDFNKVLKDINESIDLKSYDQTKISENIYSEINKDQNFYLTSLTLSTPKLIKTVHSPAMSVTIWSCHWQFRLWWSCRQTREASSMAWGHSKCSWRCPQAPKHLHYLQGDTLSRP